MKQKREGVEKKCMREEVIDGEMFYIWRIGGLTESNTRENLIVKKTREGKAVAQLRSPT